MESSTENSLHAESTLRVTIVADGVERRFVGTGPPAVLVAAFRAWLAGPDLQLEMAADVEAVEAAADAINHPPPVTTEIRHGVETGTMQSRVLAAVQIGGPSTSRDVAAFLDIDEKTASGHLSNLVTAGKLERTGTRKYGDGRVGRNWTVYETTEPELETVWSGSLEREGKAPGLSSPLTRGGGSAAAAKAGEKLGPHEWSRPAHGFGAPKKKAKR